MPFITPFDDDRARSNAERSRWPFSVPTKDQIGSKMQKKRKSVFSASYMFITWFAPRDPTYLFTLTLGHRHSRSLVSTTNVTWEDLLRATASGLLGLGLFLNTFWTLSMNFTTSSLWLLLLFFRFPLSIFVSFAITLAIITIGDYKSRERGERIKRLNAKTATKTQINK